MKFKVDKKMLLALAGGICGLGSFIIELVGKKDESNEIAEKAAEIVMEKLSNKN